MPAVPEYERLAEEIRNLCQARNLHELLERGPPAEDVFGADLARLPLAPTSNPRDIRNLTPKMMRDRLRRGGPIPQANIRIAPPPEPYRPNLQSTSSPRRITDLTTSELRKILRRDPQALMMKHFPTHILADLVPRQSPVRWIFQECENNAGSRLNSCVVSALSASNYSSPEEASLQLGRAPLVVVTLIQALYQQDSLVCDMLLRLAKQMNIFEKSLTYIKVLMETHFTFEEEVLQIARNYAVSLKEGGLVEVPNALLDFLAS